MKNRRARRTVASRNRAPKSGAKGRMAAMLAAALVLSAVAGGAFYLVRGDLFPIREVSFVGNKHLTGEELLDIMDLKEGSGMLVLSLKDLHERLTDSPWVREAGLRKEFPGRLVVLLEEAVPLALLKAGDDVYLIDEGGEKLERVQSRSVRFLPVISIDPKEGEIYGEALSLARTLRVKGLTEGKVEIKRLDGGPEALAVIIDGLLVKIGQGEYEEKLKRLFELEREIKRREIDVDYVDLRFANRVVVKPIQEVVK